MEQGELLKEYESIPRRHPSEDCIIAQLPESSDKNRFRDVLPYDSTRVELVPTKENNTGYINASHISFLAHGRAKRFNKLSGLTLSTVATSLLFYFLEK